MSKVRCDQVLQSIAVQEEKIEEVNNIAEHGQKIITEWQQSENGKLERQVAWLARQCEEFIRASGDKTIQLPHGRLSLRAGKATVAIVDEAAFMQIAEKKGLVRIKPEEKLPDLLKIHEFIRVHGFPPA
jgi:predicted acetyltransferase